MWYQTKHLILLLTLSFSTFVILLFSTPSVTSGKQSFQAPTTETKIFLPIIFKNYPYLILFSSNNIIYTLNSESGNLTSLGPGYGPKWSPDHTKIAFIAFCCDDLQQQLRIMNADGSEVKALSSWSRAMSYFWSPEGTKLAFRYPYDYTTGKLEETYVINRDGTGLQLVSDTDNFVQWSPNGTQLIVNSTRDYTAHIINSDGTGRRLLTDDSYYPIQWSPNGDKIAFRGSQSNKLNIINYDGTGLQSFSVYDPISIQWSPDGTKLAFIDHYAYWQYKLYIMNNDGTGFQKLTDYGFVPTWNPDGTKLAFTERDNLCIVNNDGTNKSVLFTVQPGGPTVQDIKWSLDGSKILFSTGGIGPNGYFSELYLMNSDGSNRQQLIDFHDNIRISDLDW